MPTNHPLRVLIEKAGHRVRSYRESSGQETPYLAVTIEAGESGELVGDIVQVLVNQLGGESDFDATDVADALRGMRVAQLGKGEIVYFRGVPFGARG